MYITILGIWGAYPEANSATSSILIEEDDFRLLLDCGSGVLSEIQKYIEIAKLNALIVSHYHYDHIADIGCLQYALMIQKKLGNRKGILPIYSHDQDQDKFKLLTYEDITEGYKITKDTKLKIGPFSITFCENIHPVYTVAVKVQAKNKTLIYTSDTEWNEGLVEFSKGADIIISEANLYEEQLGKINGHLTGGETGLLATKAEASKLILTHLPHYGDHQEILSSAKSNFTGEVLLAVPSLKLNL